MQTEYLTDLEPRYEGQLVVTGNEYVIPRAAKEAIRFGLLVVNLPSDEENTCRIIPAGVAADVDAIKTNVASTAGIQTFVAADFNGAIGDDEISPAKNFTITQNSHADWDATTLVVEGLDENGLEIVDNIVLPNGGNATTVGTKKFSKITRVTLPAQTGTNGTATFGVGVDYGVMQGVLGVAQQDANLELGAGYAAETMVNIVRRGYVAVWTETACEVGDECYVRIVATGGEVRGQFRRDMDGTLDAPDAIRVPGMHFFRRRTTAGLVWAELNLGGL